MTPTQPPLLQNINAAGIGERLSSPDCQLIRLDGEKERYARDKNRDRDIYIEFVYLLVDTNVPIKWLDCPELGVTNYYQPDRTRYPILLLGQKYPLQIHWENDIYGVRQTTTQDHYADDGILYAGKNEPPNIMIMYKTADKKYKKKHIGSGCKVVPWIYDNEGRSLGNLVDDHHSIRIHDLGDYEPPSLDIKDVHLEEKVKCFMDGKKPHIEYFNDTLERHDPATVFAPTDDKENKPFKHLVFTNI
ncbi:hypothetical protein RU639_003002 [Aspergillus parasiticus]